MILKLISCEVFYREACLCIASSPHRVDVDGEPVRAEGQALLRTADEEILAELCAGDAGRFFSALRRVEDANNVCGLPDELLRIVRGKQPGQALKLDVLGPDGTGKREVAVTLGRLEIGWPETK